jgi:hypothetical protein
MCGIKKRGKRVFKAGRKGEKGKRRKGEKPALACVPGFSGEAQGNNSAEDFGVMTKI